MKTIQEIIRKLQNSRHYKPSENDFKLINKSPVAIYYYSRSIEKPYEKGEKVLLRNSQLAHLYLKHFYKIIKNDPDRLKLFENSISKKAEDSCDYAVFTLKSRFPLGENAISKDLEASIAYARDAINGRFELGENIISKDESSCLEYAKIIKERFVKGEKTIKKCQYAWGEYQNILCEISIDKAIENKSRISDKKIEKKALEEYSSYHSHINRLIEENLEDGEKIINEYSDLDSFPEIIVRLSKNNILPDEINNYMIALGLMNNKNSTKYLENRKNTLTKVKNFLKQHKGKSVDELILTL